MGENENNLELLDIENGIEEYTNDIYQFREPLKQWYNITVNKTYETKVIQNLKEKVLEKGMIFDFPDFIGRRCLIQIRVIMEDTKLC